MWEDGNEHFALCVGRMPEKCIIGFIGDIEKTLSGGIPRETVVPALKGIECVRPCGQGHQEHAQGKYLHTLLILPGLICIQQAKYLWYWRRRLACISNLDVLLACNCEQRGVFAINIPPAINILSRQADKEGAHVHRHKSRAAGGRTPGRGLGLAIPSHSQLVNSQWRSSRHRHECALCRAAWRTSIHFRIAGRHWDLCAALSVTGHGSRRCKADGRLRRYRRTAKLAHDLSGFGAARRLHGGHRRVEKRQTASNLVNTGTILFALSHGVKPYEANPDLDVHNEKALRIPHGTVIAGGVVLSLLLPLLPY